MTMRPMGVGNTTTPAGSNRVLLRGSPTTRAVAGVANFTALQLEVCLICHLPCAIHNAPCCMHVFILPQLNGYS